MDSSCEQTIVDVWRQVLVEDADVVELGTERYPVRLTPKRRLREVDCPGFSWFMILFSVAGRNRDGTLLQDLRA
jgi:hypothetical protein